MLSTRNQQFKFTTIFLISILLIFLLAYSSIYTNSYKSTYDTVFGTYSNISNKPAKHSYKYNVIFIETNHKSNAFTPKQLCAIESAAKNNPRGHVRVFSINAKLHRSYLNEEYPNIQFNKMNVTEFVRGTPLAQWWRSGKLTNNSEYWHYAHLSDALRLLLLYKYSGVYSDLDMVTIASYSELAKYTSIALENRDNFGNSFLTASKIHDPFYLECLKEFSTIYDPNSWSANGLELLTRVFNRYCNVTNFNSLLAFASEYPINAKEEEYYLKNDTCGVYALPFYVSSPKPWNEAFELFSKNQSSFNIKTFLYTKAVHFNNYATNDKQIQRHDCSIIEFLFKFNCPFVYQHEIKSFAV